MTEVGQLWGRKSERGGMSSNGRKLQEAFIGCAVQAGVFLAFGRGSIHVVEQIDENVSF